MSKLPSLKSSEIIKALQKAGFIIKEGSKHCIIHDGRQILSTVPRGSKAIKKGTLSGILKDCGLSLEQFLDYL